MENLSGPEVSVQVVAPTQVPDWDLAQAFEARRMEVEHSKAVWRNWFLVNIVLLFGAALLIFFELSASDAGMLARSWLEFAVALPLVYSAIFFHAQHSKAREYLEEYAFKTTVARSLDTYREMLRSEVSAERADEQKKLLDFLFATVRDLYTPPRAIISKHPVKEEGDVKVGVVEKLGDVFKKFIPSKL
jgi:hypothetical protein